MSNSGTGSVTATTSSTRSRCACDNPRVSAAKRAPNGTFASPTGAYRPPLRGSAGAPLLQSRRLLPANGEVPDEFEYFGCPGSYRSVLRRWRRAGARWVLGGLSRFYTGGVFLGSAAVRSVVRKP